jgi:hypothetical protein
MVPKMIHCFVAIPEPFDSAFVHIEMVPKKFIRTISFAFVHFLCASHNVIDCAFELNMSLLMFCSVRIDRGLQLKVFGLWMEHETRYAGDESSSENGSWSSYENLPPEDTHISEDGADSANVSDVYVDKFFYGKQLHGNLHVLVLKLYR